MNYQLTEEMGGYKCDNCELKDKCVKEFTVSDTSEVIILQVKAFSYINGITVKNNSTVLVDGQLDIFYGKQYSLHGVIYHIGTANSGHYICKVKYNDKWIVMSDTKISNTSDSTSLDSNATPYVVFYKRTGNSDILEY